LAELLRPDALLLIFAAPCVGSFLGVVIERLPAERPILWGRSACDHCGARLGARDLVPLASWALARGRCRHCGGRLSLFYPAIELAALAVALWSLAVLPGWLAWAGSALGWTLLALAVIDARHMILPNELSLPLIPAGLAVAWALDPGKLRPGRLSADPGPGGALPLAQKARGHRSGRRQAAGRGGRLGLLAGPGERAAAGRRERPGRRPCDRLRGRRAQGDPGVSLRALSGHGLLAGLAVRSARTGLIRCSVFSSGWDADSRRGRSG
jgi:leader peptidase (prepilin peptidase)/N-methyltransferase